jgi:hypothetical protein
MKPEPLLAKCEALLEMLYAHPEHAKLRRLVSDIEALRDRLNAASEPITRRDHKEE